MTHAADEDRPALLARRLAVPIGTMVALAEPDGRLVYLDFDEPEGPTPAPDGHRWRNRRVTWTESGLEVIAGQLGEYFAGRRREFALPLEPDGNSFHQQVWAELRAIPYGVTISYGELARRVGRPGAARAVGRANGSNPIAIVIPCHRVIGADGKLTGYSGGIERKAALLAHERAITPLGQASLPLGVAQGRSRRVR